MARTMLRDKAGFTVEPAVLNGVPQFLVRAASGHALGIRYGETHQPITTPEQIAALGVDLRSLQEVC